MYLDTNSMKDVEIDSDLINGYEQAHVMWLEQDVTMIQRENVSEFQLPTQTSNIWY